MAKKPLPIGLVGISLEAITSGTKGWCTFPTGPYDEKLRRIVWKRHLVPAIEDIRTERDVIIATEQEGVKEHTPVELSYQSRAGPYQRVTEDNPLPVTMGSKDSDSITHYTDQITALGNTLLVSAPSGEKIKVHYYLFSNEHLADTRVGLRFTTTGNIKHQAYLANQGGAVNANLVDVPFEGAENEDLYVNLATAAANGVWVTVAYSTE